MEAPRKRAVIYDIASDLSKAYAVIFSPKPYGFDSLTANPKQAKSKEKAKRELGLWPKALFFIMKTTRLLRGSIKALPSNKMRVKNSAKCFWVNGSLV